MCRLGGVTMGGQPTVAYRLKYWTDCWPHGVLRVSVRSASRPAKWTVLSPESRIVPPCSWWVGIDRPLSGPRMPDSCKLNRLCWNHPP